MSAPSKYQRIAADLRAAIREGRLRPGDAVPSENMLAEQYGVASLTARAALTMLRDEGLVIMRRGVSTIVREVSPRRRIAASRYQRELDQIGGAQPPETSFTADRGIDWADYRLDKTFEEIPAPARVADLLGLDDGGRVLARHFVFHAKGQPEQISDSYLPLDLVAGTPVADPANEPWPGGNIAQLATLGIIVSRVTEAVTARMPTAEERQTLQIPAGVPVLAITRVMLAGPARDRPVEAAVDIVIPADRTALDYVIDLDPPGD